MKLDNDLEVAFRTIANAVEVLDMRDRPAMAEDLELAAKVLRDEIETLLVVIDRARGA